MSPQERKATVRARMQAYDNSIKTDILLAGRDRSMNITYEPYYHGPYNPTVHGNVAPYGYPGYSPASPKEDEGSPRSSDGARNNWIS